MPSTMTHTYFIMDIYDRLPFQRREFLLHQIPVLKVFAQGMDPLYFYHLCSLKKGKRVREFGAYFHEHQTLQFFQTLINYIKYNDFQEDPEVMAFLYGMLSHYFLDSTCHPFVVYYGGYFQKNQKETWKYNQKHAEIERDIDNYFIWLREEVTPWKYFITKQDFLKVHFSDSLKEVIDFTFREVFGIHHMSHFYEQAIKDMYTFFHVFRNDRFGFKYYFYRFVDHFTKPNIAKTYVLSFHQPPQDITTLLNLNHEKWCYPTDKKKTSNASFLDLYLQAMFRTISVLKAVDHYIYRNQKIAWTRVIQNKSYLSGVDCSRESVLKYFKF